MLLCTCCCLGLMCYCLLVLVRCVAVYLLLSWSDVLPCTCCLGQMCYCLLVLVRDAAVYLSWSEMLLVVVLVRCVAVYLYYSHVIPLVDLFLRDTNFHLLLVSCRSPRCLPAVDICPWGLTDISPQRHTFSVALQAMECEEWCCHVTHLRLLPMRTPCLPRDHQH